jgi:hypothetical protein
LLVLVHPGGLTRVLAQEGSSGGALGAAEVLATVCGAELAEPPIVTAR